VCSAWPVVTLSAPSQGRDCPVRFGLRVPGRVATLSAPSQERDLARSTYSKSWTAPSPLSAGPSQRSPRRAKGATQTLSAVAHAPARSSARRPQRSPRRAKGPRLLLLHRRGRCGGGRNTQRAEQGRDEFALHDDYGLSAPRSRCDFLLFLVQERSARRARGATCRRWARCTASARPQRSPRRARGDFLLFLGVVALSVPSQGRDVAPVRSTVAEQRSARRARGQVRLAQGAVDAARTCRRVATLSAPSQERDVPVKVVDVDHGEVATLSAPSQESDRIVHRPRRPAAAGAQRAEPGARQVQPLPGLVGVGIESQRSARRATGATPGTESVPQSPVSSSQRSACRARGATVVQLALLSAPSQRARQVRRGIPQWPGEALANSQRTEIQVRLPAFPRAGRVDLAVTRNSSQRAEPEARPLRQSALASPLQRSACRARGAPGSPETPSEIVLRHRNAQLAEPGARHPPQAACVLVRRAGRNAQRAETQARQREGPP
jgi:hypothetical protein